MIDVHCHLNFKAFKDDYDEVIKKAFEDGVTKIVNVGTRIDSSRRAVELANTYENLYAIVGVHPHHSDKILSRHPELVSGSPDEENEMLKQVQHDNNNWLSQLEILARHSKVVAIGECGMDYYKYQSNDIVDPKLQKDVFIKQIKLAYKLKLPLQIHNRHAGSDIIKILLDHRSYLLNPPGMFHCLSGDLDFLRKVLDLGFYVGFDGNITYGGLAPREDTDLKDLVRATPLNRILVETDSPYLTPEPHRGSRNEPSYVILVAREIARIKGVSFATVQQQTSQNAKILFQL